MGLRVDNKKLAEVNSVFKSTCIFVRQQLDRSTNFTKYETETIPKLTLSLWRGKKYDSSEE